MCIPKKKMFASGYCFLFYKKFVLQNYFTNTLITYFIVSHIFNVSCCRNFIIISIQKCSLLKKNIYLNKKYILKCLYSFRKHNKIAITDIYLSFQVTSSKLH